MIIEPLSPISPLADELYSNIDLARDGFVVSNTVLGRGSYSSVKLGKNMITSENLAVKVVDLIDNRAVFENEIVALQKFSHPNLVKFIHVIWDNNKGYLFMDKLDAPWTLEERISVMGAPLPFDLIVSYTTQLILALEHVHGRGVAHRDLKPSNVLICSSSGRVTLCDFGLAYIAPEIPVLRHFSEDITGSPLYMAPEVILCSQTNTPYDPFKYDCWGLGMIIYAMFDGDSFFSAITQVDVLLSTVMSLRVIPLPSLVPATFQPIVAGLLQVDPKDRWTIQKAKTEFSAML